MYRDIPSQPEPEAVTNQPQDNLDLGSLDFRRSIPHHEKSRDALLDYDHEQNNPYEYGPPSSSVHHDTSCQLRHLVFLPLILAPSALCMLALIYVRVYGPDFLNWGYNSLVGRDDTSTMGFSSKYKGQSLH